MAVAGVLPRRAFSAASDLSAGAIASATLRARDSQSHAIQPTAATTAATSNACTHQGDTATQVATHCPTAWSEASTSVRSSK